MAQTTCTKTLYTQFLIAAHGNVTATALEGLFDEPGLHDRVTRWLASTRLSPRVLWEHVEPLVERTAGYLIADDSVLDKSRGPHVELAQLQYSGAEHGLVHGIDLVSLVWAHDGNVIPVDYRIFAKSVDGKTKHDHFRQLLAQAYARGFQPPAVLFDSWYAANETLLLIRSFGWTWVTELKKNRLVSPRPHQRVRLDQLRIPAGGRIVHLKGYGPIKVVQTVAPNGDVAYLATNDLTLTDVARVYARRWAVETYHRGLKQTTGITKCQARRARSQRTHIACSLLAFVALEQHRRTTGQSWYATKFSIIQAAVQRYLIQPTVSLRFA